MQAVIFDMDETLVDTERVSQAAWRAAARDFGIVIPESILHAFVGCSIPNAMKMIDEEFGDPDFTVRLLLDRPGTRSSTPPGRTSSSSSPAPPRPSAPLARRERPCPRHLERPRARRRQHGALRPHGPLRRGGLRRGHRAPQAGARRLPGRRRAPGRRPRARCVAVEDSFNGVRSGAAGHAGADGPRLQRPHTRESARCAPRCCRRCTSFRRRSSASRLRGLLADAARRGAVAEAMARFWFMGRCFRTSRVGRRA